MATVELDEADFDIVVSDPVVDLEEEIWVDVPLDEFIEAGLGKSDER